MASLTISQIQAIKEHMTDDVSMLSKKFKAKKNPYDTQTVLLNELDDYLSNGWEEVSKLKYKARIQKLKPAGRRFEDDIWCMFYNLGFRHLNYDENLVVQWGDSPEDKHQLDVVAIGEVGLTGEIRSVSNLNQRLSEVSRLGFKTCIIPKNGADKLEIPEGLTVYRVRNLQEAIATAL